MKITNQNLKKARPENVRRLAKWLRLKNIETMSHKQLIRLLMWGFKRREKRERGLIE